MAPVIEAVLFDKDGTLIDFRKTWTPAYHAIADELEAAAGAPGLGDRLLARVGYDGAALDPDSLLVSGTNEEIVAAWAAEPELAEVDDLAARVDRVFHDHAARAPAAIDDLAGLLARLRGRGLKLGIATNDSTAAVTSWVATAGFAATFDFIAGADAGHGGKPEPGMVNAFCASVGIEVAAVALVGDSLHDMQTARAAGCGLAVAVLTGIAGHDWLAPHADVVIPSIAELEGVLG
jgi:phosphoglycolate phosphatase